MNVVEGVELREPATRVVTPSDSAADSTGKFCNPLGPLSVSPPSLAVGPSPARSIPSAVLSSMLLKRIELPEPLMTDTPALALRRMKLGAGPPIVTLDES